MKLALMVCVLTLMIGGVRAGEASGLTSGNEFLRQCSGLMQAVDGGARDPETLMRGTMCTGYMTAFSEMALMLPESMKTFCIPEDASLLQTVRVAIKFLSQRPELLNKAVLPGLIVGFTVAWPCKK
ncbi:Rap1a/Tai family immunity protein [Uliginosibacterium sp. H3]|uniref:Rap1a/Tai family immunity protein n=1 Tax=Uliginosibacterium silvisoli TaxID=3114758 RepID=A0ABU6K7E0_9RHOO|nr:Rap1a/Tai family immunity protein [Uliginosibacterium sp. H3]